jgi:hypothetical protein
MAAGVSLGLLPEGGQLGQSNDSDRDAPVGVVSGSVQFRTILTAREVVAALG